MHIHETELSIEYAKMCEKNLYQQISLEENAQYENWLRKLEVMDYLKRTRIFFQSLKSRNREQEFLGSIKNADGRLSNSLSECLHFWANYCQKLYEKPVMKINKM